MMILANENGGAVVETKEHANARGPRPGFNAFGARLYSVMVSREIVTAAKLAEVMNGAGKSITAQTVSNYWTGRTMPSKKFMQDVGSVLALTYEEKQLLSTAAYFDE